MGKTLLDAPCVFCGYNGYGYYQQGTHHVLCPWHKIGGLEEREKDLRYVVAALFKERKKTIAQQPHGAEPTEIKPDCGNCLLASQCTYYGFPSDSCGYSAWV